MKVTLEQQITELHEKIDALVAKLVDERYAACPGVPRSVVENIVIGRAAGCRCEALKLVRKANGQI
jgi:hypothetical protein